MNLILKTPRLLLRPVTEDDLDLGLIMLTDPAVMKYVGKAQTKERVIQDMPTVTRRCAGGAIGIWCIIDQAAKEKLGTAVLLPMPIEEEDTDWDLVVGDDVPDCEIEVGYILRQSAWGKGYATEACKRLLQFAFEQTPLEEVVATTDIENVASQRVLKKCGLIEEGLRRAYAVQCPGFRITRRQWVEGSHKTS